MTESEVSLLREMSNIREQMGEMRADIRTVKHDMAGVQQGLNGLSNRLNGVNNQQARSLGFFAGMAFLITGAGGVLIAFYKLLAGGHG